MSLIEKALRQLEKDKQTVSYGAHPGMPQPIAAEEVYEKADDAHAEFFSEEHDEPRPGKRRRIAGMVVVLGLGAAAGWYMQQGGQQAPSPAAPAPKLKAVPVTVAHAIGSVPEVETGVAQQAQKNENNGGSRSINQQQTVAAVVQPEVLLPPAFPAVQEDAGRLKSKPIPPASAKQLPQDALAMQQPAARTVPAVPTAGAAQKQRGAAKTPRPDVTARAANLLQSDAENADSLNNQGVLLLEQGAAAQARDYFEKALKLAPDHEKALNNMGLSLYAQGRTAEALNYYERAVKVNPGNIETCVNMGIALRSRRDFTRAAEVFQKALALNPAHPETLYNYGLLLKDMGQQDKSRICFEQFLKTAPPHLQGVADSVRMYLQASTVKKQ
jgi:tetratricopeptide (TPR) repeat protein